MRFAALFCLTLTLSLSTGVAAAPPQTSGGSSGLSMSTELLDLFRVEMRKLMGGTQAIAVAIPAADWDTIVSISRQMAASYVLEQELDEALKGELAGLPQHFKDLDEGFHARTQRLADAAIARDAEAVAYQFSRLLETCAACHAAFAKGRFPNFQAAPEERHGH